MVWIRRNRSEYGRSVGTGRTRSKSVGLCSEWVRTCRNMVGMCLQLWKKKAIIFHEYLQRFATFNYFLAHSFNPFARPSKCFYERIRENFKSVWIISKIPLQLLINLFFVLLFNLWISLLRHGYGWRRRLRLRRTVSNHHMSLWKGDALQNRGHTAKLRCDVWNSYDTLPRISLLELASTRKIRSSAHKNTDWD